MSKIATEMLRDINKNTVDFQSNYDDTEKEPVVLPARFPNLWSMVRRDRSGYGNEYPTLIICLRCSGYRSVDG